MATTKATLLAHSNYAPLASPTFTGTVAGITKTHVGLGNVDNVADASQTSLGTVTSGTFNGTIGDSATMSNKYWRTARVHTSVPITSGGQMINTVGTTHPYFEAGDGDTTNFVNSDTNKIKVVREGIYHVSWAVSFLYNSSNISRAVATYIQYGTTTGNLGGVAYNYDQIANTDSNYDDYGSSTTVWVGHCAANSYLRFGVTGYNSAAPYIDGQSRYCIALIRPL